LLLLHADGGVVDKRLERRICGEGSCEESGKNINKTLEDYSYAEVTFADDISRAAANIIMDQVGAGISAYGDGDGWNTPIPTSPTCPVQRLGWLVGWLAGEKGRRRRTIYCVIDQIG
jgi:hypothetical protein